MHCARSSMKSDDTGSRGRGISTRISPTTRPGFVTAAGAGRLGAIERYVRGIGRRLDRLPENPGRDARAMEEVRSLEREYGSFVASLSPSKVTSDVVELGWQLDELRISLFAQTLGTAGPVSSKRILRELARLRSALAP